MLEPPRRHPNILEPFLAESPDGNRQPILVVPNYSFANQETYVWWRGGTRWHRGTTFHALAHFDNSTWNPANPDPSRSVVSGPAIADERMAVALVWTTAVETLELTVDATTGVASGVPSASKTAK